MIVMQLIKNLLNSDIYKVMIDSGAKVSMGPLAFAKALGEEIHPPMDDRKIGTAAKSGNHWMYSSSWLHRSNSYRQIWFSLLSTCQIQKRRMTIAFPIFETVCHLSTMNG